MGCVIMTDRKTIAYVGPGDLAHQYHIEALSGGETFINGNNDDRGVDKRHESYSNRPE
jgi:hypothetical protein